jgi:uncharacterized protein (DUF1800 family)
MQTSVRLLPSLLPALVLTLSALVGCGGGGGGSPSPTPNISSGSGSGNSPSATSLAVGSASITEPQAHRFLMQASFGPSPASVARAQSIGEAAWIDEQWGLPLSGPTHVSMVTASTLALAQTQPRAHDIAFSWWTHALTQPDQLRQRVAYALSQIFVVSTTNALLADNSRLVAAYMDMLTTRSGGTFRDLLEGVALHPAMGLYLSHLLNRKEDTVSGRVPDENFAREVMQLFSIGLYELEDDGTPKLVNGQPVETYTSADVKGLAKVFTGLGWYRPPGASAAWWECFYGANSCYLPELQQTQPMGLYTQEHSTSVKNFLGISIPVQNPANPSLSIRLALDRLATHSNTAPFISKQLIQRLVSSNPSGDYVRRITQVFRSSGGDLKVVVKAILLDPEARTAPQGPSTSRYGKLREPVLRWAHLLRALPHQSTSKATLGDAGFYLATDTSSPSDGLSQTPMAAPSVFNFYRPGYKPPHTGLSGQNLLAPEMQLATETSVVGYANFVAKALDQGWGLAHPATGKPDIQFDLSSFVALDDSAHASRPSPMVDALARQLTGSVLPTTINEQVLAAVGPMPRSTALEKRRRAAAAVLLIAVSPVFLVQQ